MGKKSEKEDSKEKKQKDPKTKEKSVIKKDKVRESSKRSKHGSDASPIKPLELDKVMISPEPVVAAKGGPGESTQQPPQGASKSKAPQASKTDEVGTPVTEGLASGGPLTIEQRLELVEQRLCLYEAADLMRRFRHHVGYDLPALYSIELPKKFNAKKRSNWKLLTDAVSTSPVVPQEWKDGIAGLEALEARQVFPYGFYDCCENAKITPAEIRDFVERIDDKVLQGQINAMCQCSLKCVPPSDRGNGNSSKKSVVANAKNRKQLSSPTKESTAAPATE